MSKETNVDVHNKKVSSEIKKLKGKIADLELTYKSELLKPQATLLQCNEMNGKMQPKPVEEVKPTT